IARRWATIPKPGGPDIADPAVRAASRSYRAMPLGAVLELLRLQAVVRGELGRVTQPALLLHGRHDHSVPLANLERVRRSLGSRRAGGPAGARARARRRARPRGGGGRRGPGAGGRPRHERARRGPRAARGGEGETEAERGGGAGRQVGGGRGGGAGGPPPVWF